LEKLPTQCAALDLLTGGGLPTGTLTQVFGAKALGKSILCFQAACATVAAGSTALVLDTEQSYMSYLVEYRLPGMNKRFGNDIPVMDVKLERVPRAAGKKKGISRSELVNLLTNSLDKSGVMYTQSHISSVADILSPEFDVQIDIPDEPTVLIVQMPDIMELLKLHGVDAAPTVSEKSENPRVELRLKSTPVYESALYQIVEQTKAKLLAVLTTSHISIDPIHSWKTTPYGGIILGHDAKFSFELTKVDAKRGKDADPQAVNPEAKEKQENRGRAIWVQRHPAIADYSRYGYATIDEEGFH
jgi:hypothetical protein